MRLPRIRSLRVGMRLWLTLAFAVIAAVTAVAVTSVFAARSEKALKGSAQDFAVGSTIGAVGPVSAAVRRGDLQTVVDTLANQRRMSIFVYDQEGTLLTAPRSHGLQLRKLDDRFDAVATALGHTRSVSSVANGRATLVAVPLRRGSGGVLLTYLTRPELTAQFGIVHRQVVQTALWASGIGALGGLLVAMLIAGRLRRIVAAASEIESGSFETRLHPWLKDELGSLAEAIDRMRGRLRDSFTQLEFERDRLARLLGRLHDGVIAVDRDLKVQFSNPAARRLLRARGLAEGDPLPDPWGGDTLRPLASALFEPRAKVLQETFSQVEGGSYTVAGLPARRTSEAAVLVLTDVSVRERRERAEREFVANAAHELRTPLATITGSIQVLQSGAKNDPGERDRFLDHIERETARLTRLTRALLVLARAQTREEEPRLAAVEIEPLLQTIATEARPANGVVVEVACPSDLEVLAEPDLVEQALANLVANAVENTERGRIVITGRSLPDGSVVLEVSDTGPGIPIERQERIFDRFYRAGGRDPRNFGLGLAIVREAVTALGGRVDLESSPGEGTTVRITLSRPQTEAA